MAFHDTKKIILHHKVILTCLGAVFSDTVYNDRKLCLFYNVYGSETM